MIPPAKVRAMLSYVHELPALPGETKRHYITNAAVIHCGLEPRDLLAHDGHFYTQPMQAVMTLDGDYRDVHIVNKEVMETYAKMSWSQALREQRTREQMKTERTMR